MRFFATNKWAWMFFLLPELGTGGNELLKSYF